MSNNSGNNKKKKQSHCDFCNRPQSKAGTLLEGPGSIANGREPNQDQVYICQECVDRCLQVIHERGLRRTTFIPNSIPSPQDIVKSLESHIIGQNRAKKVLAVAVTNHYKRLLDEELMRRRCAVAETDPLDSVEIDKANILLLGPTGSGKTLLCRTLARMLDVPFAIGDATTLTEAGYVGEDVENLLLRLIRAANGDIEKAQSGIIYIDEVDKLRRTTGNVSITRDVSGEGVQQSLLKMLEGTVANVPPQGGRKHPEKEYIPFDTTNVLFICGGAFVGLEEIIAQRVGKNAFGFQNDPKATNEKDNLLTRVTSEDLIHYGMIPEFVGRLPVIAPLDRLDEESLVRVLKEPKHALLKQYKKLFRYSNSGLEFTDEAIREIARKALDGETGARALRSVIEDLMLDLQYNIKSGCQYTITDKVVRGEEPPLCSECKEAA